MFFDDAFGLYVMDFEERRDRIEKATGHLINYPEDEDEIQDMYELTDEEWELVQMDAS